MIRLGGSDISEATHVRKLVADFLEIYEAVESYAGTCVLCTVEKRDCPQNHHHFVHPEVYNKMMNVVNNKLCKTLKGKIILPGGLIYLLDVHLMDRIHPTLEGRKTNWSKVHKVIKFHNDQWAASANTN